MDERDHSGDWPSGADDETPLPIDPFANNDFASGDVRDVERTNPDDVEVTAPTQEEADESRQAWLNASDPATEGFDPAADPLAAKREKLGFRLAWWGDLSLLEALDEIMGVVEGCSHQYRNAKLATAYGVSPDAMAVNVAPMGILNGPLVMSALQILGVFMPEARQDIENLLASFEQPVATEEEQAQLEAASAAYMQEFAEKLRADLAARGDTTTRVVTNEEELQEALEEIAEGDGPGFDPSAN